MKIHFIGIGGIGTSALARYYLASGHQVSGSDLVSSEITDFLRKKGAKIIINSKLKIKIQNLIKKADLIVYSPAVPKNHPDLKLAKKLKIKCLSYPQALGGLTKKYFTIAVCGTHGKSTTAAILSLILIKAGLSPTVILGTKLKEFGDSNFYPGKTPSSKLQAPCLDGRQASSKILVIEADEHFASFLNYWPKIIVLTNVEADHLDYYKNFKNYLNVFKKFIFRLPERGVLVANKDDKGVFQILKSKIKNQKSKTQFKIQRYSLKQEEAKELRKILKIPGEHNVYNALAALTAARLLNIPDKISFKALSEYRGAWRRFDIRKGKIGNKKFILISDYAHHPTEVKATLEAAKEHFLRPPKFFGKKNKRAKKKIWCVFQPHQYQRTFYLFDDFVDVFSKVSLDKLIITDVYDVAGREDKTIKKKVNSKKLAEKINNPSAVYLPKIKIKNFLKKNLKGGEAIIIMGAGDIYDLSTDLLDRSE
jgi:UDP-N-acetylmuramate--alanine ligase